MRHGRSVLRALLSVMRRVLRVACCREHLLGSLQPQRSQMNISQKRGNVWIHFALLAVLAFVTATARLVWHERYRQERMRIEARASVKRIHEIAAGWNSLTYAPASSREFGSAFVERINFAALGLTDIQKGKLKPRLLEVLNYLRSPTLSEYRRLKTEGLHYRFEVFKQLSERPGAPTNPGYHQGGHRTATNRLQLGGITGAEAVKTQSLWLKETVNDQSEWSNLEERWSRMSVSGKVLTPSKILGICLDQISIAVSQTNSTESILKGKVSKGFTVAQLNSETGFKYGPDIDIPGIPGIFVHISFFARSNSSTNAGPVYLSLGWSQVDDQWAVITMITDAVLKLNVLL